MIEIKIKGDTPEELLAQLSPLFHLRMDHVAPVAPVAVKAPRPVPTKPIDPPAKKGLTPELVRAAGLAAAKTYGKEAVKSILEELGAEGLSALNQEHRVNYKEKWVLVTACDPYEALLQAAQQWGLRWSVIAKDCDFTRLQKAKEG